VVGGAIAITIGFAAAGFLLAEHRLRRRGKSALDTPDRCRAVLVLALLLAVCPFVTWAMVTGHRLLGIAVLGVAAILPELVLAPLALLRSRRAR
jgi:hypothetical protein